MKVSEITIDTVRKYCGLSAADNDEILNVALSAAKEFVKSYTGMKSEQMDGCEEISIAVLALTNDYYIYRFDQGQRNELNPTVANILSMHRQNLL